MCFKKTAPKIAYDPNICVKLSCRAVWSSTIKMFRDFSEFPPPKMFTFV